VVADLIRRQTPLAAVHGVKLQSSITPDAANFVFDPSTLSIALSNLVQNAIQASHDGTTVSLPARKSGAAIEIKVGDEGEGISPQNLENIFNPFFTTKSDGVGLGLAIVSKIIDEHHSKITASSVQGKGTTFQICLPAAAVL
jgi:signal transduction histidine kinase